MHRNKLIIIIFFILVAILLLILNTPSVLRTSPPNLGGEREGVLNINGRVFQTEIVKSKQDIARGLSGRESIDNNQAMLFVLPVKKTYVFWMKEMNFNIDLLWIDGYEVVGFEKNMQALENITADKDLPAYSSPQAVDKVLEIKAGSIDNLNIKVGDIIEFESKKF